jgi:lipoprotein-releasing system permease protein
MTRVPSFELFVALRYLLAQRKQAFISLISLISVLGVAVGVMALLIALALMTGLQGELRDRIVGSAAHVYVFKVGGVTDPEAEMKALLQVPRVQGAAPVLMGKAMISSGQTDGFIDVKGIDPAREKTVTQLGNAMRSGSLEALERGPDDIPGILIGIDLAEVLGVQVGDDVQLISPRETLSPVGPVFRRRNFRVVGIFSLGLYQFDSESGFIHLDVGKRVFGEDSQVFIELRVDDMFKSREVVEAIHGRFGTEYRPQEWSDMNKSLFSALWLEKMAISITIGLIVMVAALNIVASLILLVMEKSRDIAILKTMGSPATSIRRIFMLQGLIIGLVGTAAGSVFGYVLIYILDHYQLIRVPVDVYQISYIPFTLQPLDFAVVVAAAIAICFVATIYPSRQAARLDPAQALRYQ